MGTPQSGYTRLTVDLPRETHRALRRYAFENEISAADVIRALLGEFLQAKRAGDAAVEAAIYRRGFDAGTTAERERITQVLHPPRPGLPTQPPTVAARNSEPPPD
jgi:hypothetical protein